MDGAQAIGVVFGLILLICPILCIVLLVKIRKVKYDLKTAQEIAHGVQDANRYSEEKHKEADDYLAARKHEAEVAVAARDTAMAEKRQLEAEVRSLSLEVYTGMVRIDAYENMRSDEIKNQLTMLRGRQDELVKNDHALVINADWMSKKQLNSQKKQILRCFNAECANILGSVTVKNVDTSRAKIQRSFEALNKIFEVDGVQISQNYLSSKFEELSLIYAYMVKEEEEKEQKKAIREQMVEEEKVRREIEREKQKIEKEETQFSNEINKLMSYMQKSKDDIERQLYIDKIHELEEKLRALQADKENVLQREQNTRAGFVYIISNVGSFGQRIYKIGMTRRLEPMDRIAELSSASVPFPFDVHAMIFSEDAPGLESILHNYFDSKRVNKVNPRKEFFRVNLDDIKKVVLENHNATVKFIDAPEATEYRETLRLEAERRQAAAQ